LLIRAELPVDGPAEMTPEQFMDLMAVDKKVQDGVIRLILLKGIGQAVMSDDYQPDKLQQTLALFQS
jgi:3-dehydroquinate synthase